MYTQFKKKSITVSKINVRKMYFFTCSGLLAASPGWTLTVLDNRVHHSIPSHFVKFRPKILILCNVSYLLSLLQLASGYPTQVYDDWFSQFKDDR